MKYEELKRKHEAEINTFEGIFFAFDDKQFKEGMERVGLTEKDTNKIYELGAGGFILRSRNKAFLELFENRNKELEEAMLNKEFLVDAFTYELRNHEYCITGDTRDTLDKFSLQYTTLTELQSEALDKAIRIVSMDNNH